MLITAPTDLKRARYAENLMHPEQVKKVQGPDGEVITLSNRPVGNPRRWLPAMKARVVAAVEGGLISMEHASQRYRLSRAEYESWRDALAKQELSN